MEYAFQPNLIGVVINPANYLLFNFVTPIHNYSDYLPYMQLDETTVRMKTTLALTLRDSNERKKIIQAHASAYFRSMSTV